MNTIRWGIIGCGDVTEVKSGPAFKKADHSELVAVMRRTGRLAADYAQRHNVPRWYDDAEALINDPEVNAVYIATPPNAHRSITHLCAEAGKPVYVEKPMALNYRECRDMIDACEQARVPLYVAYYRRALPRFLKIKRLIDSNTIGEVRFVNMSLYQPPRQELVEDGKLPWRVQPDIAGGGLFVDLASHMLDFLDFALGPIQQVRGFSSNQGGQYPAEDIVTGTFIFESGVHGTGTWCFTGHAAKDLTEIVGSAGRISFSTFDVSPVVLTTADGHTELEYDVPRHIQQPLIQEVVNALLGLGPCKSTGESGARTSWVMEQMLNRN